MRTTVDIPDELRAKLLDLAARRGEKGFSGLVSEAVARYVVEEERRADLVAGAKAVLGRLAEGDANDLRRSVAELRTRWR